MVFISPKFQRLYKIVLSYYILSPFFKYSLNIISLKIFIYSFLILLKRFLLIIERASGV